MLPTPFHACPLIALTTKSQREIGKKPDKAEESKGEEQEKEKKTIVSNHDRGLMTSWGGLGRINTKLYFSMEPPNPLLDFSILLHGRPPLQAIEEATPPLGLDKPRDD